MVHSYIIGAICLWFILSLLFKQRRTGIRISRTRTKEIGQYNPTSIGASYTWVESLSDVVGPDTNRIVMYHARLKNLAGLENAINIKHAFLGFNLIEEFRPEDAEIKCIEVLDLVGNPIRRLKNCPPCKELIVSATLIEDLTDCPETVEILRIGHSTHLRSLKGRPNGLKIIECNCAPNLEMNKELLPKGLEELHWNGEVVLYQ